jgi:uncharacterized protein (TIGR02449 family)
MLEEVQRLQTLIQKLTSQLQLVHEQNLQLRQDLEKKPQTVEDPAVREALELTNAHNRELEEEITALQESHQSLQMNATALAERYGRLEQNAGELKNRFEALITTRDNLTAERDKLINANVQLQQSEKALTKERDDLLVKNEHAKRKVEAIIQRLASLGQSSTAATQAQQDVQALSQTNLDKDKD